MRKVAITMACSHDHVHRDLSVAGRAIKFSHGTGLCNMPLFYAAEKNLFDKYGIDDDVVMTPMAGTSAIQLATGQVEMGVIPYRCARRAWWSPGECRPP